MSSQSSSFVSETTPTKPVSTLPAGTSNSEKYSEKQKEIQQLLSMGPSPGGTGSNNRGTGDTAAAGAGQGTGAQFGGKC